MTRAELVTIIKSVRGENELWAKRFEEVCDCEQIPDIWVACMYWELLTVW